MLAKRADERFPDVLAAAAALSQALLPTWGPRV
jgi:hypothetical protein